MHYRDCVHHYAGCSESPLHIISLYSWGSGRTFWARHPSFDSRGAATCIDISIHEMKRKRWNEAIQGKQTCGDYSSW